MAHTGGIPLTMVRVIFLSQVAMVVVMAGAVAFNRSHKGMRKKQIANDIVICLRKEDETKKKQQEETNGSGK